MSKRYIAFVLVAGVLCTLLGAWLGQQFWPSDVNTLHADITQRVATFNEDNTFDVTLTVREQHDAVIYIAEANGVCGVYVTFRREGVIVGQQIDRFLCLPDAD